VLCALLTLAAPRADACSICLAGDPSFSSHGTSSQSEGDVSVYVEFRSWEKRSGLLPHGDEPEDEHGEGEPHGREFEDNESQRLDVFLSWTPLDRLTLTLNVPFAFNEILEVEGDERVRSHIDGIGDVVLQVSGVLWRNRPVLPSTWLEGRTFLKLPTGRSHVRRDGVTDPHLQAGTGSVDFGFGVAGVHRLEWSSLYASTSYRVNTEGSLDYEYGDVFLANLGIEVPLGHLLGSSWLDRFTPGFELNYRWADRDEVDDRTFRDSGGQILYLTPSLRIELPWWTDRAPSVRGAVQIPTTDSGLRGFQEEDPIWFAGLLYRF
jgi:hypothetical protein